MFFSLHLELLLVYWGTWIDNKNNKNKLLNVQTYSKEAGITCIWRGKFLTSHSGVWLFLQWQYFKMSYCSLWGSFGKNTVPSDSFLAPGVAWGKFLPSYCSMWMQRGIPKQLVNYLALFHFMKGLCWPVVEGMFRSCI